MERAGHFRKEYQISTVTVAKFEGLLRKGLLSAGKMNTISDTTQPGVHTNPCTCLC